MTPDSLTARAGLPVPAQLMDSLYLADCVDRHFPQPRGNRGFALSLYFALCALAYNVFALMRGLLPGMSRHRAISLRQRLYALAAKVVCTGRRLIVKLVADRRDMLTPLIYLLLYNMLD